MTANSVKNKLDSERAKVAQTKYLLFTTLLNNAKSGVFHDLKKAFDSIHHETLWRIMQFYVIPHKAWHVLQMPPEQIPKMALRWTPLGKR